MQTSTLPLAIAGAFIAIITTTAPARAQNTHSWVSAAGSGTDCTRAAPCALFDAYNATVAGGVISVLDSGDLVGTLVISKSLTIRAEASTAVR